MAAVVTVTSPRANARNTREEAKVVRSMNFPVPIFCLDHRFVRRNCAQLPATVTLLEQPIRTGSGVGSTDRAAILAKVLTTNSFQAPCRKANSSQNRG